VTDVTAQLLDAAGREVECWLSTPQRPLLASLPANLVGLIPKGPLRPAAAYTARVSACVGPRPWARTWRFTTLDPAVEQAETAAFFLRRLNDCRRQAGLRPVTLDPALSRACLLHARYLACNHEHPAVQGLGVHKEEPSLPGATPEGARAGQAAVIASLSHPRDALDGWLATLYHRLPLLDPDLERIGYAQELLPSLNWITVLDAGTGKRR
jgi:uncharacterized protein YkwD